MLFLTYMGLPPAVTLQLMQVVLQMKVMSVIVAARYLQAIERQRHQHLPPGEQYRRHVQAGGYRP